MTQQDEPTSGFYPLLRTSLEDGRLISVFTDETDEFEVGQVESLSTDEVRMVLVGVHGGYSGYRAIRISRIQRVEWDSAYEKRIEVLRNGFDPEAYRVELNRADSSDSILIQTLRQAMNLNLVVGLCDEEDYLYGHGYVVSVDEETVTLKNLNDSGENDGNLTMRIDLIDSVTCNSRDDRALRFLHKDQQAQAAGGGKS